MIAPMTLALVLAAGPAPLAYRFEEVKSSVYRLPGGSEKREVKVAAGETAAPGDHVRTGWWGRTLLSVPGRPGRHARQPGWRRQLGPAGWHGGTRRAGGAVCRPAAGRQGTVGAPGS